MAACTIYDWARMRREHWRDGKLVRVYTEPDKVMARTPGYSGDLAAVTFDLAVCVQLVGTARADKITAEAASGKPFVSKYGKGKPFDFSRTYGDWDAFMARVEREIYDRATSGR
ncbi:hypothetical protein CCO03_08435 [Comamonas serinivorans]|uniref:Uncharacterized protein n=1 Tax=Comamonas serinivorans TaxID=1082851 RepID=A0A1Y0EM78_9BURK|nr:hypothetical protein [Comamonas serinivorans]ARU04697.1 hypothetical protein CCO03_08435 [Comamonas serinivorans]